MHLTVYGCKCLPSCNSNSSRCSEQVCKGVLWFHLEVSRSLYASHTVCMWLSRCRREKGAAGPWPSASPPVTTCHSSFPTGSICPTETYPEPTWRDQGAWPQHPGGWERTSHEARRNRLLPSTHVPPHPWPWRHIKPTVIGTLY